MSREDPFYEMWCWGSATNFSCSLPFQLRFIHPLLLVLLFLLHKVLLFLKIDPFNWSLLFIYFLNNGAGLCRHHHERPTIVSGSRSKEASALLVVWQLEIAARFPGSPLFPESFAEQVSHLKTARMHSYQPVTQLKTQFFCFSLPCLSHSV